MQAKMLNQNSKRRLWVKLTAPLHLWYVGIFSLCFVVFLFSQGLGPDDSQFAFLVSESILWHHTQALNGIVIPELDPQKLPTHWTMTASTPTFYQLERVNGKILYIYPPGTSILSLPFVAALNLCGLHAIGLDSTYDLRGEARMQRIVAALLMAGLASVFMAGASTLLTLRVSLAISLIAEFGTQIWSTASRTMWSHTWEIVLGGCVVLMLLRVAEKRSPLHPVILATLVSWAYFVRPTGAIVVLGVTVYVILWYRNEFLVYAATGLMWLGSFLIYSWLTFGRLLPDYYRQSSNLRTSNFGVRLAGVLISPSRGLFIFVPVAIIPIYLVIRHWRDLPHKPLAMVAAAIVVANVLLVASWVGWWGGDCFGPRLLTDTIPWFVMLAILGWKGRENYHLRVSSEAPPRTADRTLIGVTALLAVFSIAINGRGANSMQANLVDYNSHRERLWDWRSPQFLVGLMPASAPAPSPDD
jgi:hypothetical protein